MRQNAHTARFFRDLIVDLGVKASRRRCIAERGGSAKPAVAGEAGAGPSEEMARKGSQEVVEIRRRKSPPANYDRYIYLGLYQVVSIDIYRYSINSRKRRVQYSSISLCMAIQGQFGCRCS